MSSRDVRVSQGGLFHSHKVQYSKETQSFLNRLIEESKLSILQRQALKDSVKKGDPLPGPGHAGNTSSRSRSVSALRSQKGEVLVPPALPRRRSYQAIVRSGAYQRDTFDPPHNSNMKNREIEKQKLQSLMTYGKEIPQETLDLRSNNRRLEEENIDSDSLFDHLVSEIKDRLEFLQEMERMGQAKTYHTVIEQEIAAKMRQMAKLDQDKFLQLGMDTKKMSALNSKQSVLKNC